MTPQRRKLGNLYLVLGIVVGVGVAAALALSAFRQNVTFYFIPTQVAGGRRCTVIRASALAAW